MKEHPFSKCDRRRLTMAHIRALSPLLVLATFACGEHTEAPMAPEAEAPLAVAATQALTFTQVSSGDAHSCGVTSDNRAYCWGWGDYGQLGNGNTDTRNIPTQVAGNLRFRQVSAGGLHTCGVATDDRAYCWGANGSGELGTGATSDPSLVPARVASGRQFRQVDAGSIHSCGVTTENRAFCWGHNGTGALGDGTDIQRVAPVAVAGGGQYRQVTTGNLYSCGVTTTNVAFC